MKKNVSVYVRNKTITPSSYYRIVQYTSNIRANFLIRSLAPTKIYQSNIKMNKKHHIQYTFSNIINYICILFNATIYLIIDNMFIPDVVIVSKYIIPKLMPKYIEWLLKRLSKKSVLYWDFDDYIFNENNILTNQDRILGKYSKNIIVTSEFLKNQLPLEWQKKVMLLPTTDGDFQGFNEDELINKRKQILNKEVRLVWIGTKSSINYLENKINILDETAELVEKLYNKKLILTVVCNDTIKTKTNFLFIRNIDWKREIVEEELLNSHIGIMPLDLSKIALGKGGFKLIQYISLGLPVIASGIGYNNKIVTSDIGRILDDTNDLDVWKRAILNICHSETEWEKYSINAYKKWKHKYSYSINLKVWEELINSSKEN